MKSFCGKSSFLLLFFLSITKHISADDCSTSWNIQNSSTEISFQVSSTLRITLQKFPFKLTIIDQLNENILLQSSRDIFARIWEGSYETAYFGYMFREGFEKEHRTIAGFDNYFCNISTSSITLIYHQFHLRFTQQPNDRHVDFQVEYRGYPDLFDTKASHYQFPQLTLAFKTRDSNEDYYGFGSYWGFTRFRGQKLYCHSEDGSWSFLDIPVRIPQPNATYIPMPLFISNRQYAVWIKETRRINFDLSSPEEWLVTTEWNTTNIQFYFPTSTSFQFKQSTSKLFDRFLRLYKMQNRKINPSFSALVEARGGTTRIPPLFVFGPWKQTGNVLQDKTEIEIVQMMIERDIPITVRAGFLHFFPKGAQQGHENETIEENRIYKQLGVTSLCYFNPYVSTEYTKLFEEGLANGYFLKNSSNQAYLFPYFGDIISRHFFTASVDYSNSNATRWYQQQIQESFDLGFNGFMLDFGEYTPIDSISSNGQTGHLMHNRFIELYQKAVYDVTYNSTAVTRLLNMKNDDMKDVGMNYQSDFLFYTRSGYTHSSQYTQLHWTGDASADWNPTSGLPAHVQACLGAGISGIAYCASPIGGYVCELYPDLSIELWIRWLQVGAFSAFMHDETEGSACTHQRVQMFNNNQTESAWRRYAKLRTQLFPYIYTAAHESHATGLPMTRHHLLNFYDDEIAIQQEYQYTFGSDVLVAPVVRQNQTSQDIYLPSGEDWIDLSTTLVYDENTDGRFRIGRSDVIVGGQWIHNIRADLLTIPTLIRAGSIIPLIDPSVFTLNPGEPISLYNRSYILHLWIFPDRNQQANGFVWDGFTMNVTGCNLNRSLCLAMNDPFHRLLIIQLPSRKAAASISSVSGQAFERVDRWQTVAKIEPLDQLHNSFAYDEDQQIIWMAVVFPNDQTTFQCQIDF